MITLCVMPIIYSCNNPNRPVSESIAYLDKEIKNFKNKDAENCIIIGNETWDKYDLETKHYRNGDTIVEAHSLPEWNKYCKEEIGCRFRPEVRFAFSGSYRPVLDNCWAVNDKRGLAPLGWKIPSYKEYDYLMNYLGGEEEAAYKLVEGSGWNYNSITGNSSGWNGKRTPIILGNGKEQSTVNIEQYWWCDSTQELKYHNFL